MPHTDCVSLLETAQQLETVVQISPAPLKESVP
jgi:hypothetical protein